MWGKGNEGQLGVLDTVKQVTPVLIEDFRPKLIRRLYCGFEHTLILNYPTKGEFRSKYVRDLLEVSTAFVSFKVSSHRSFTGRTRLFGCLARGVRIFLGSDQQQGVSTEPHQLSECRDAVVWPVDAARCSDACFGSTDHHRSVTRAFHERENQHWRDLQQICKYLQPNSS